MAFIEKNKQEFERLIEQDKQAMASQMPDNLFGMLVALVGAKKPAQEGDEKKKEEKEDNEEREVKGNEHLKA
jgi:import inner membrane translocase subunit TIM50